MWIIEQSRYKASNLYLVFCTRFQRPSWSENIDDATQFTKEEASIQWNLIQTMPLNGWNRANPLSIRPVFN